MLSYVWLLFVPTKSVMSIFRAAQFSLFIIAFICLPATIFTNHSEDTEIVKREVTIKQPLFFNSFSALNHPNGGMRQVNKKPEKENGNKRNKDNCKQQNCSKFVEEYDELYHNLTTRQNLYRPNLAEIPHNVTVRFILIKLQELVEKHELIESTVRIQLGWRDSRLGWDPAEFSGVRELILPADVIWIPDVAIINLVGDIYRVIRDVRFEVKVLDSGQVWWHPTGVLRTFCKLRLAYFPFDRQKCSYTVESPTFDSRFLHLKLRGERNPVDLRMYVKSDTWQLVKTFGTSQKVKVGSNTHFTRLEFWLILERARLYHSINFILPSFILSAIQTAFLYLPTTHPQRVGSTTVTMLSVMVFQSMVVAQLPKTSESVPLLSIYIDLVILISATTVCTSIFTALCHFNNDQLLAIPGWLQACAGGCCRKRTCQKQAEPDDSLQSGSPESSQSSEEPSKWVQQTRVESIHDSPAMPVPISVVPKTISFDVDTAIDTAASVTSRSSSLSGPSAQCNGIPAQSKNEHISHENNGRPSFAAPLPVLGGLYNRYNMRRPTFVMDREEMNTLPVLVPMATDSQGNILPKNEQPITWLDVMECFDRGLNLICALATSIGPIIIFGIIPNIVEHDDYPQPIGENFTIMEL